MTEELYKIRNLLFSYSQAGKSSSVDPVLNIPELGLQKGLVTVFRGHNGSGKTTFLKILCGLLQPLRGEIFLFGKSLHASERLKQSILVQQEPYLFHGSVYNNLVSPLWFSGIKIKDESSLISETLNLVGLAGFEKRKARELSGGERKRVAIARALMINPSILILDEPDANVDKETSHKIETLIIKLRERGMSIILCSHNRGLAYRVSDVLIDLYRGSPVDHHENIFKGSYRYREGLHSSFITGNLSFSCPSRQGEYSAAVISANDVFLCREKTDHGEYNQLKGTLVSIESYKEDRFILTLDCGVPVKSRMTSAALHLLGVCEGDVLYAVFNPSAVRLY